MEAAVPGGVAKVKRFILKLEKSHADGDFTEYDNVWKTIQRWWPNKKVWDDSDFIAVKAQQLAKEHLREIADKADPSYATALAAADQYWSQMHEVLDSPAGKLILKNHAEDLVEKLTKDITTIREVRKTFGDNMVTKLAQRRLNNLIADAEDLTTKEITSSAFSRELKSLGGPDGGVGGDYLDELLQGHPQVRQSLDDMEQALILHEGPINSYKGMYEMIGGGAERVALTTAAKSPSTILTLLTHFALGKKLGEQIVQPSARNILLGGAAPYMPGRITGIAETVRRGEAATGTLQQLPAFQQVIDATKLPD